MVGIVLLSLAAAWRGAKVYPLSAEAWWALGLGSAMVFGVLTYLRHRWAPFTAPIVALSVGVSLGGLSAYLQRESGGFFGIAVLGAVATFPVTLWLLHQRVIPATDRVRIVVHAVAGALFLLHLTRWALVPAGVGMPGLLGVGPVGIAFCALLAAVAAVNLALDLQVVAGGMDDGRNDEAELAALQWYGAFALLVTMLWNGRRDRAHAGDHAQPCPAGRSPREHHRRLGSGGDHPNRRVHCSRAGRGGLCP